MPTVGPTVGPQTVNELALQVHPGAWNVVGAASQPAFQNAWAAGPAPFAPPRFRSVYLDEVALDGQLFAGASGTIAFTLPSGFTPKYGRILCAQIGGGGGLAYIYVDTSGHVTPYQALGSNPVSGGVFLDGLVFPIS